MRIRKSIATVEALRRIVYVLRSKLAEELAAIGEPELRLAVPSSAAYYMTSKKIDGPLMARFPVVVVVEQPTPATTDMDLSQDGGEIVGISALPVRVRLAFLAPVSFTPLNVQGKVQEFEDFIFLCAERYKGAIIEALTAYAADDYTILEIAIVSDLSFNDVLPEQKGGVFVGGCIIDLIVTQEVSVPAPQRTI